MGDYDSLFRGYHRYLFIAGGLIGLLGAGVGFLIAKLIVR
jgi:hypothetical protein